MRCIGWPSIREHNTSNIRSRTTWQILFSRDVPLQWHIFFVRELIVLVDKPKTTKNHRFIISTRTIYKIENIFTWTLKILRLACLSIQFTRCNNVLIIYSQYLQRTHNKTDCSHWRFGTKCIAWRRLQTTAWIVIVSLHSKVFKLSKCHLVPTQLRTTHFELITRTLCDSYTPAQKQQYMCLLETIQDPFMCLRIGCVCGRMLRARFPWYILMILVAIVACSSEE